MVYLQNNLANHEVHVADYYFRRGAWLAAANRAQVVVKDFPRAPAAEKALYLMVRSYHALQLPELETGALQTMQKNFPQSPFLIDAQNPSAWWEFWNRLF